MLYENTAKVISGVVVVTDCCFQSWCTAEASAGDGQDVTGEAHVPVDATGPSSFHDLMLSRAGSPADCGLTSPSKFS